MPKINLVEKEPLNEQVLKEDINRLGERIEKIKSDLAKLRLEMNKQILQQKADEEIKKKFATYISYNPKDQKRLNTVIKDVNLIKKQINLSKLSPIFSKLQELEGHIDNLENKIEECLE
jgi:ABC-type phosphate transport system auxiliary subunit